MLFSLFALCGCSCGFTVNSGFALIVDLIWFGLIFLWILWFTFLLFGFMFVGEFGGLVYVW